MYFDYKQKGLRIGTYIPEFEEEDCVGREGALVSLMTVIEGLSGVP